MQKTKSKALKKLRLIIVWILVAVLCAAAFIIISNLVMTVPARSRIHAADYYAEKAQSGSGETYDAILVLGCSVHPDGSPSAMLADRMETAIELYKSGAAPVLLVSGDESEFYSETDTMREYALISGVPEEAILEDGKGYSTYESMYRAAKVFGYKKILVVSQKYHLARALYIGKQFGLEAYGANAQEIRYYGQLTRDLREIAARSKDFVQCIFKPEPI